MAEIRVLDSNTIDKIAAGEVVERPASIAKELVENAVDAGATAITVEIKDGGISFLRVTDNGNGIEASQVRNAFLRHATSKIQDASDLSRIVSLGFRGEALSSIAAVSQVELITKTEEALTGVCYSIEGAKEISFEEVGAPKGTTMIVKNIFFNTPVRRKFLKQSVTEGGYITDLMEHMALSRPDVAFKYTINGQTRFNTSGNGELKEVIYRIYGKDITTNLVEIQSEIGGMKMEGYLGKPILNRANRNFEIYFLNGRYVKSQTINKSIEEGYKEYLMQHKYPFCVLHFSVDTDTIDVNVHPTKMDVRFMDGTRFYDFVSSSISAALKVREMIPDVVLEDKKEEKIEPLHIPEPFEEKRMEQNRVFEEMKYEAATPNISDKMNNPVWNRVLGEPKPVHNIIKANETVIIEKPVQMDFFEEKMLSVEAKDEYRILGQIFDTYWLVAFRDKLFIIDQHAAHEKVKYERMMEHFRNKSVSAQTLNPPIVLTLSGKEEMLFKEYEEYFLSLGFEIEEFGGSEYAIRSVPMDLYGCNEKEMFSEVMDELMQNGSGIKKESDVVCGKIASMACKAAVKGNNSFSMAEMEALIDELLTLENPYNCPHGRPTIIAMSKYEIEKKFKRIV